MGSLQFEPLVVFESARSVALLSGGALVSVRRGAYTAAELEALRGALAAAAPAHPRGFVSLTTFRLDRTFPLAVEDATELGALVDAARALDPLLAAVASVVEFGGVRAAAMQLASSAVWRLARPRAVLGQFETLTDALVWLGPHAQRIGALEAPADYVRLHRECERRMMR
jgi:hypothetical protein